MHGVWHGMMGLWMLIPIILVVLVIYLLLRSNQDNNRSQSYENRPKDALDILNERYARGEISDEEYRHKKDNLIK